MQSVYWQLNNLQLSAVWDNKREILCREKLDTYTKPNKKKKSWKIEVSSYTWFSIVITRSTNTDHNIQLLNAQEELFWYVSINGNQVALNYYYLRKHIYFSISCNLQLFIGLKTIVKIKQLSFLKILSFCCSFADLLVIIINWLK